MNYLRYSCVAAAVGVELTGRRAVVANAGQTTHDDLGDEGQLCRDEILHRHNCRLVQRLLLDMECVWIRSSTMNLINGLKLDVVHHFMNRRLLLLLVWSWLGVGLLLRMLGKRLMMNFGHDGQLPFGIFPGLCKCCFVVALHLSRLGECLNWWRDSFLSFIQ